MTKKTSVLITKPEMTTAPSVIEVPNIETVIVPFVVRGLSPLIVNNFSEKAKTQMTDEQTGAVVRTKAGGRNKPARNIEEEYQRARILDDKKRDCVLARWVKAALTTASKMPDVQMASTLVRQSVFVMGDLLPIECAEGPHIRNGGDGDIVRRGRFGNKVPMPAFRPEYWPWVLRFEVQFEPKLISHAWLVYLVRRAGLSVGLCEWRPEKNGEFGRFDLQTSERQ